MKCPTDGMLRSCVDGELGWSERAEMEQHVQTCGACRERFGEMRQNARKVRELFDALEPPALTNAAEAYSRFRQTIANRKAAPLLTYKRPVWAIAAVACLIALLFGFTPARLWAQQFLAMLRVQKIAVVPVDFSAIEASANNSAVEKLLTKTIADQVVVTMKPADPQTVPNQSAATALAGFPVRLPATLGDPQEIRVHGEGAFHATLNRDRMQDVLSQVGRSDIQIPASADGATIAVHVPKIVNAQFGNCARDAIAGTCIILVEAPTPIISVPPGLNLAALAEAGLQIAGMSAAEAHAFCQTVDWTSTLVLPIPQGESSSRAVSVDGVTGTLIETAPRGKRPAGYHLLWIKNGIVYSLQGVGDAGQGVAAADSLS
jgi:hypothetical protein